MTIRNIVLAAAMAASLPLLQGCFPLAMTGMGAAALMASDRRTTGMYIEDEAIEWKAFARLREYNGRGAHVNPTSFNRRVLLTGEAPTEALKKEVEDSVRKVENVVDVVNEVKARMVNNGRFSPNHVKVLTEAGTVYLMGLVTAGEADAAVEIARTTSGVNRVVKVFEAIK